MSYSGSRRPKRSQGRSRSGSKILRRIPTRASQRCVACRSNCTRARSSASPGWKATGRVRWSRPSPEREVSNLGVHTIRRAGVSHIPEDRRGAGLVLNYSVADNLILGRQRTAGFAWDGLILRLKAIFILAQRLIKEFDIRTPSSSTPARTLSGGNQQKIIIAREMATEPRVLLAAQPTRGVDIGAIEFIHRRLIDARDGGAAILLVSAELDEIRSLADRLAVMYEGRIVS